MAIKELRLPNSVKHLEEGPSDKALALGREEVERIFQARYEQSILRNAVGRQQQLFNHKLDPADILRQYDGIEVCEQGRGNIVRDSSRTSDSNSENLQQLQRAIGLSSRSWNSKYNGKSPQQKEGTFVRMDVTMGMDQP
ncbi:hypothetical protein CU097_011393 [Rhizopus azygosporus]|uniref:Uncharacterized protein n=1 Tax=Rhizopus azygosporus TaxID=86630 RepID=A0A367JIW9_RHIAZ|nr:hypothetical protein CU097_011393 [Rhizopus azygosporus]